MKLETNNINKHRLSVILCYKCFTMKNAKLDNLEKKKEIEKIFSVKRKKSKSKWNKMKTFIKFIFS